MSWHMRRTPTYVPPSVVEYEVLDFEKVDQHRCSMFVKLSDGSDYLLTARVSRACTYGVDGTETNIRWTVQGTDPHGMNVLLRVLQ